MTASRPEAEPEYSRGQATLRGALTRLRGRSERAWSVPPQAVQGVALVAAVMLAVAEFLPLYRVRTDAGDRIVSTVSAGSHHSYALLPLALLAALLAGGLRRSGWPVPGALALLGLAALGIALIGDLPAVHRAGLLGTPATGLHEAHTVAGAALYLETLGAIALLVSGAAGLMLGQSLNVRALSHRDARSREESGS
jgi:hypothetical protein